MKPWLETERMLLRPFVAGDLDWLAPLYADKETRRFFPQSTLDRDQTCDELNWFIAGGDLSLPEPGLGALMDKQTGEPIGRAGLIGWEIEGRREVEIAYLVARARWREGFGAEIAKALVRHGFLALGLDRLIALIHPDNVASIRTAQKAGLVFERRTMLSGMSCELYAIERWQDKTVGGSLPA